jgi:hypothetical protein
VPSPASLVDRLVRSLGKFGATPRRVAAALTIGQAPHSGTPIAPPDVRSRASLRPTLHFTPVGKRLAGKITSVGGVELSRPDVVWKGRRAVHRQSRRWSTAWSPEQISHRLRLDYPEDPTMRISHEAIYQSLYIQGRGALRRELMACLRSGRALRLPRERARFRGKLIFLQLHGHEFRLPSVAPVRE